jgi:putative transposase
MASGGLSPVLAKAISVPGRAAESKRRDSTLIRTMAPENSDWGAPKIHGELQKLGFEVSERTVARYLRRMRPHRGDPAKRCLSFLANHREAILAFDFFTLPTLTFQFLYCFFVIEHSRRKIL